MSLRARLLNRWLKLTEKRHMMRADTHGLRRSFELKARFYFHPPRGTTYRWRDLTHKAQTVPALGVNEPGQGPLILYFHGGGYVFGSPRTHAAMLARLSRMAGLPALLPQYRLAPEHPFPAALDDALSAYCAVADHPGGVVLGGDSAGGGLALSLLAEITRQGLPQPLGLFSFSPLTDLSFSSESVQRNAEAEVILPAERAHEIATLYLDGREASDPRVSPIHADFKGAAPVWLAVGDTEILLDDTRLMAERIAGQGVDVTCVIEHDLPHVWPIFQGLLPEANQTLRDVADWITALSRP